MAVERQLTDSGSANPLATSHTFTGMNIGAAAGNRLIFACILSDVELTSVAVGGISLTKAVSYGGSSGAIEQIWWGLVPEGETANVEVQASSAISLVLVDLYRVVGADLDNVIADSDGDEATSAPLSIELDIPAGGIAIASAVGGLFLGSGGLTWMGAIEDADTSLNVGGSFFAAHSSASVAAPSGSPGHSIEVDFDGTPTSPFMILVGVAINPAPSTGFSNIYHGEDQINAIKLGSTDIKAVYLGSTKIFESA